jgi:eukaryotic-like serine/threonine-protein kinase
MLLCSGTRLGPYEIVAALGAGGMGEVYRARDPRLGREVAIKILPVSYSADPDRLRRFEQEARAAARLNHPNILTVHEIAAHDGQPYVVSELLEGETLRDAIEAGPLAVKKSIEYSIQMCRGLTAAHEKGIVHRDLKPEDVFVTSDGRLKILDFGLAKLTEAAAAGAETMLVGTHVADTSPGVVVGTVGYMSPEQVRGQPVDQRSDIFNLGAILYELLSGTRGFAGATPADTLSDILGKDPPELTIGHRSISPALDRVVRHCLEKAPSQRFQSASDVAFARENLGVTSDVPVTPSKAAGIRRQ